MLGSKIMALKVKPLKEGVNCLSVSNINKEFIEEVLEEMTEEDYYNEAQLNALESQSTEC
jgi:hypothetical protein